MVLGGRVRWVSANPATVGKCVSGREDPLRLIRDVLFPSVWVSPTAGPFGLWVFVTLGVGVLGW